MLIKLKRKFYNRDTIVVARELLGKYLIHRYEDVTRVGKIVEVEAYLGPHDLASHSRRGPTKSNQVMFGDAGHAYVYLIYGIYYCLNVVTGPHASAILIRALEPVKNIELKTNGPGLLTKAMKIDKGLNGHDLLSTNLYLAKQTDDPDNLSIVKRPRIGVDYAKHWAKRRLRFYLKGNPYISKK